MMNREEIENSKKGVLSEITGHKNLLVSFGGIQQGIGVPVFEFFNSISDIPCDKLFIRDFNQAWYQKGVDAELNHIDKLTEFLQSTLQQNKYEKTCFLGNSMGGYAAILFGTILNADTVIAFAPQTFIDHSNRLKYKDKRWTEQIERIYAFENKMEAYFDLKQQLQSNDSYKTQILVHYSSSFHLDRIHAERIGEERNVFLHPSVDGGHSVVKVLRENGDLKSILKSALE